MRRLSREERRSVASETLVQLGFALDSLLDARTALHDGGASKVGNVATMQVRADHGFRALDESAADVRYLIGDLRRVIRRLERESRTGLPRKQVSDSEPSR